MKRKNFFTKRLPALLLALFLMIGTVPSAFAVEGSTADPSQSDSDSLSASLTYDASWNTITYTVAPGKQVDFSAADFRDVFEHEYPDASLRYVSFDATRDYDSVDGYICYNSQVLSRGDLNDKLFYDQKSSYGDYPLRGLSFVAGRNFSGTFSMTFRIYRTTSDYVDGTLVIRSTSSGSSSSSLSSSTVTYEVAPGDVVSFSRSDFRDAFQSVYDDYDLYYVTFQAFSDYSNADGYIYYNYGSSGQTRFSRSDFDGPWFYYSSSSYGEYPLNGLSFVAGKSFNSTVKLSFRAYGSNARYVDGTLVIQPKNASTSGSTITYEVAPGGQVSFDRSDFDAVFQKEYSGYTMRYVTFEASSDYSNADGYVYYDYGYNDATYFTRSGIDNYLFYYSSSTYGDYPLNALSFVAGKSFNSTVKLSFRAYYSDSRYVDGTLVIQPKNTPTSGNTITYEVAPGSQVSFSRSDFNTIFQKEYSGYTLRYVTFSASNDYTNADGYVYYDYGYNDATYFTRSEIDDYVFYYSSSSYGDYPLNALSFVAGKDFNSTVKLSFRAYYSDSRYADGTLVIQPKGTTVSGNTITYEVAPNSQVAFDRSDFNAIFQKEYSGYTMRYIAFSASSDYASADGYVYYDYGYNDATYFTRTGIDNYLFYYSSSSYGDYPLNGLSFVAGKNFNSTIKLSFRAYYSDSRYVDGTLVIQPKGTTSSGNTTITYEVAPGNEVSFDRTDFNAVLKTQYSDDTLRYVTFSASSDYSNADGYVYYDYGYNDATYFTRSEIDDYVFYYSSSSYGDYPLNALSFVAGRNFNSTVELSFRAYYSSSRYVDGTLVIQPKGSSVSGDIFYSTTYGTAVQINPNDIARYFTESCPGYTLQYVRLEGVPATGSLYYNYYGTSTYGAIRQNLNASNYSDQLLYFSPSSSAQYSLSELTYVPTGVNYCAAIPFTAYGSGSRSVSGTILISVNFSAVAEVYGVIPKGGTVTFPSSAIYSAVANSTSSVMAGIQLLKLPAATQGTVYVGSGTSTKATTTDQYAYSGTTPSISQLRFVAANGFTGSVEIPYAAYSSSGNLIAVGKFCLGVVNGVKTFTDMTSSTWCYKYVAELSDAKVIDGYTDGSFRPNNTVTYGQALKLIMLAAGYAEQPKTGTHPFSGYLTRAKADGLVSDSITNLDTPITRLAVAQIAAKAMKLNISGLSSVKPFTDTNDPYVQALNAAGIVEGYFDNGTSTYKPNNTLTRGQISAIVWRMDRSK